MRINQGLGRRRVHIARPRTLGAGGLVEIEVAVDAPASIPASRVDLYWNEEHLLRFDHPPYRASLELPFAFEGDYLRAVARFADGNGDEDTLLKTRRAFTIATDVEMIELYTVVEDAAGRPVIDLRPDEVRIFEEGRRQELLELERAEEVPLRLALTIDISESMQPRMDVVKRAAQEFADTLLGPRDQALLAAFNHRPFLLQGPTGDPEILGRDIERLPVVGGTSLYDAIIFSLLQLRELPGRKAVVLLTDGKDKHSRFSLHQALDFARRSSVPLYLIGPVLDAPLELEETTALRRLAVLTGGALYLIRSEHQLPSVYAEIAEELRHQYVLAFQSDYAGRSSEWRSLEVEITRPGVRARTTSGYYPQRRER
jgi:VWFA-related protein